jgi:hypothetical protein
MYFENASKYKLIKQVCLIYKIIFANWSYELREMHVTS